MNLRMGSQTFQNVTVPVLWGTRAVVQDKEGRLSVIDLAGESAKVEILGDKPATGVEFLPSIDGFIIIASQRRLYSYNPQAKTVTGIELKLPECQIQPWEIRVGTNRFSGSTIVGFGVGISIQENTISLGEPLPPGLAKLVI